jgi:Tfp pilus assembly protein PilV
VLAALLIVAVAAVAVIGGITEAVRTARRTRHHVTAVALADARLNEVAATPTDSLGRVSPEGRFAAPFEAYRWTVAVSRVADAPGVAHTQVRVGWDGGSYELATDLYRGVDALDAVLPRSAFGR